MSVREYPPRSGKQVVWTCDLIVERIREWADLHGEPPAGPDWRPYMARKVLHDEERARRFEDANGYWPSTTRVINRWGSWRAAIEAAGFESRTGRPPRAAA